jgi:hypothetical protein
MKTILALAVIISAAFAQNVIFDAAPYHHAPYALGYLGGHHGYLAGHHGYLGNYLASGAVPGYAVWPGYFGHALPVAAEEEAEEEDAAVEEASRKKRSAYLGHHGLGYLGYGHRLGHLGYAAPYAPYAYSHAYAAPYAFAPYAHHGLHQIPHGAPFYKVAAPAEEEAEEEDAAVEEASRKKRSVLLAPHHGLGYLGYAHHTYVAPAPLITHSYTAAVPVETEFKYKTAKYEDQDEPTPADTTLVALEETEHTGKTITYEPKVFTYTAPAHPFYHALLAAPAKEEAKEEERKKRSVVLAHHGLGPFGYAHHGLGYLHHGYAAAVPVTTEYKYKTITPEAKPDEPTPADTTLVDLVEKEHTAKAVHLAPAYVHYG